MLAALALKFPIGPLNTCIAALLCLFSIFSFFPLVNGVLRFFEPTALAVHIDRDLFRWIQLATPAGYQWTDESFQAHYQKAAERQLNNYSYLVKMASQSENLYGKTLVDLGQRVLAVLGHYSEQKLKIPSSSYWFRRSFKHKDWMLASHNEVEIALATGKSLQPESVADLMWFETDVARILGEILHELGERKDLSGVVSFASNLRTTMGILGINLAIEEAVLINKTLATHLRRLSSDENLTTAEGEKLQKATNCLAIVELHSLGLINLLLGLSKRLETLPPSTFGSKIEAVNWCDAKTLYADASLPRRVVQEFENLQDCLDFESRLEGKLMTPLWLLKEFSGRRFVQFFDEAVKAVVDESEVMFGSEVDKQLKVENYILVAELVQRGLEASYMFSKNLEDIQALSVKYLEFNRSKEYEWPKTDWNGFQKRIASLRERSSSR